MTFDEWWNSADADSYRAHMDGLHGEDVRRVWDAATAIERARCAALCEAIEDEYRRREGRRYPELKSDAETGAGDCADAIRKEPA